MLNNNEKYLKDGMMVTLHLLNASKQWLAGHRNALAYRFCAHQQRQACNFLTSGLGKVDNQRHVSFSGSTVCL